LTKAKTAMSTDCSFKRLLLLLNITVITNSHSHNHNQYKWLITIRSGKLLWETFVKQFLVVFTSALRRIFVRPERLSKAT